MYLITGRTPEQVIDEKHPDYKAAILCCYLLQTYSSEPVESPTCPDYTMAMEIDYLLVEQLYEDNNSILARDPYDWSTSDML